MSRLQNSIKEKGIMVPLIVEETKEKGKYLIVDGERRYKASKKLKLKQIPVEIVSKQDPTERMIMRFHLQDQHANWSVFDRARAIAFFKEAQGLNNVETAELLGVSKDTVGAWTGILELSKRSRAFIIERRIPFSYANKVRTLTNLLVQMTSYTSQEIEIKLLEKYENGTLRDMNNFWKVNKLLAEGKDDNKVVEFVFTKKMTMNNLLGKTEMGSSIELDGVVYKARILMKSCTLFKRKNKTAKLTIYQRKSFEDTIDKISELL